MDQNANFNQNMDALFTNLEEFTRNESVLGKPFTHGDKTLIPVVSITLGYGSGNSAAKSQQGTAGTMTGTAAGMGANTGNNTGAGAGMGALGLGARISTEAVVVIDKDNVSMMTISSASNMTQLMDKIPQMLTNMNQGGQQKQGQQGQQGQGQQQ